jgi:RNA polymerase sigma-70 factor (ECF subfamily)
MEDRLLIWRFKRGSSDALRRIYTKYSGAMFTLAAGLVREKNTAEDIVHDVFVKFAQSGARIKMTGNLKSLLMTSAANKARDFLRERTRHGETLAARMYEFENGDAVRASDERLEEVAEKMGELPYEQREVILLHLHGGLKFKAIAEGQGVSIDTVRSRYRYGIEKLREKLFATEGTEEDEVKRNDNNKRQRRGCNEVDR